MNLLRSVYVKNKTWSFEEYTSFLKDDYDSQFHAIINSEEWKIRDNLTNKVTPEGKLKPFHGDTTVLPLNTKQIALYKTLQECIYSKLDFLSEKIFSETFHITVHDLSNGTSLNNELSEQISKNRIVVKIILKRLALFFKANPELSKIDFIPYKVYPGYNIALVTGMLPATDKDFRLLMNIYKAFEQIVKLPYMLKPHITLAYFRPVAPSTEKRKLLFETLSNLKLDKLSISLDIFSLSYQIFSDMNNYKNIFTPLNFEYK